MVSVVFPSVKSLTACSTSGGKSCSVKIPVCFGLVMVIAGGALLVFSVVLADTVGETRDMSGVAMLSAGAVLQARPAGIRRSAGG